LHVCAPALTQSASVVQEVVRSSHSVGGPTRGSLKLVPALTLTPAAVTKAPPMVGAWPRSLNATIGPAAASAPANVIPPVVLTARPQTPASASPHAPGDSTGAASSVRAAKPKRTLLRRRVIPVPTPTTAKRRKRASVAQLGSSPSTSPSPSLSMPSLQSP